MKKQLLLYLFIVAVLINVFTYMYFTKKEASQAKMVQATEKRLRDSINLMYNQVYDANYFSLELNDRSQNYFEQITYQELIPLVKDELLSYNDAPEGNKYVDLPKMGEQKFIINKLKVLNARWIIADFSNGQMWGEVLLKYFVSEDKKVRFEIMDTFFYPAE